MMPLFWIALAFVIGTLCGSWFALPLWTWVALTLALFSLTIIGRKYYRQTWLFARNDYLYVWPVILLLAIAVGGLRYGLNQPQRTEKDLAWYNDRGSFTLVATVVKNPDRREDAVYLQVSASELYDPAAMTYHRIKGKALVKVSAAATWQLGDELRFTASPKTPSDAEDFSYRDYLERSGVYTVIYYPASTERVATGKAGWFDRGMDLLRTNASRTIFSLFPQPESGLMAGILLGNDNDLPDSVNQAYRDTGTAHVIAISGFNMVMLARLVTLLFSRFLNKKQTALFTVIVLLTYASFVGGSPSVNRAAIMAGIAFGGELVGRRNSGLNALGLTTLGMLLDQPLLLWDASFQLSFLATLGMLLFAAPLQDGLTGSLEKRFSEAVAHRLQGPINDYFLSSLAAQVMTLPVISLQFHRFSLTSFLANPLVLPVQPFIWVGGMLSVFVGLVWLPLGRVTAAITWPMIAWSNGVAEVLASGRWGTVTLDRSAALWIALACVVLVFVFLMRNYFMKLFKQIDWIYIVVFLALFVSLTGTIFARRPDGNFHLSLLRNGEGTAIFLRSPSGASLLIDPDGSPNELASSISSKVSPWDFHVDAVILTRREAAKSMTALNERLPVRQALLTAPLWQVGVDETAVTLPEGVEVGQMDEYEVVRLEEGLTIQSIASEDERTALLIVYGNTRILIPGGVSPEVLFANPADNLGSLTMLILDEEDITNLPADMWENLNPRVILWNSTAVPPVQGWLGPATASEIEFVGNGNGYSINIQ